jgi:hypothetical protein
VILEKELFRYKPNEHRGEACETIAALLSSAA